MYGITILRRFHFGIYLLASRLVGWLVGKAITTTRSPRSIYQHLLPQNNNDDYPINDKGNIVGHVSNEKKATFSNKYREGRGARSV